MELSKNNCFLTEEAINFISRTEKKKEGTSMLNAWVLCILSSFIMESEERQVYNSYIT